MRDTGVGISPEGLARLFRPFGQARRARAHPRAGSEAASSVGLSREIMLPLCAEEASFLIFSSHSSVLLRYCDAAHNGEGRFRSRCVPLSLTPHPHFPAAQAEETTKSRFGGTGLGLVRSSGVLAAGKQLGGFSAPEPSPRMPPCLLHHYFSSRRATQDSFRLLLTFRTALSPPLLPIFAPPPNSLQLISRDLARAMGGDLSLTSDGLGLGCCCVVTLPLASTPQNSGDTEGSAADRSTVHGGGGAVAEGGLLVLAPARLRIASPPSLALQGGDDEEEGLALVPGGGARSGSAGAVGASRTVVLPRTGGSERAAQGAHGFSRDPSSHPLPLRRGGESWRAVRTPSAAEDGSLMSSSPPQTVRSGRRFLSTSLASHLSSQHRPGQMASAGYSGGGGGLPSPTSAPGGVVGSGGGGSLVRTGVPAAAASPVVDLESGLLGVGGGGEPPARAARPRRRGAAPLITNGGGGAVDGAALLPTMTTFDSAQSAGVAASSLLLPPLAAAEPDEFDDHNDFGSAGSLSRPRMSAFGTSSSNGADSDYRRSSVGGAALEDPTAVAGAPAQQFAPPPLRVYAAEDDALLRRVLTMTLRLAGMTAEMVEDGLLLESALEADPLSADIILTDSYMGGGDRDGLPTLGRILALYERLGLAPPPVIVVTGCARYRLRGRADIDMDTAGGGGTGCLSSSRNPEAVRERGDRTKKEGHRCLTIRALLRAALPAVVLAPAGRRTPRCKTLSCRRARRPCSQSRWAWSSCGASAISQPVARD